MAYRGQCLCGGIQFKVDMIGEKMGHCHCSMCRKFHGAAFATFGEVLLKDFHWLQGEDLLQIYKAENGTKRKFCSRCGSSLIFESAGEEHSVIEFALASLDDEPKLNPDAHIYLSTRVDWVELNDGLPKYLNGRTKTE
jgi:hypothetical protein